MFSKMDIYLLYSIVNWMLLILVMKFLSLQSLLNSLPISLNIFSSFPLSNYLDVSYTLLLGYTGVTLVHIVVLNFCYIMFDKKLYIYK